MGAIGSLYIKVGANISDFDRGMNRVESRANASVRKLQGTFGGGAGAPGKALGGKGGIGGMLAGAGMGALASGANAVGLSNTFSGAVSGMMIGGPAGAAVGAAVGAIKDGVDLLGSAWHKVREEMSGIAAMSREAAGLGLSAADLAGMQIAAGAGADHLAAGLMHFERELGQAADGSEEAIGKFRALGLNVEALAAMDPAKAFGAFADAIAKLPPGIARTNAAMSVLSRHAALPLLAMLGKGAAGIEAGKAQAGELGLAPTADEVRKIEAADLAFKKIGRSVEGVWQRLTIQLAPGLEKIAREFPVLAKNAEPVLAEIGKGFSAFADVVQEGVATLKPLLAEAADWFRSLGLSWPDTREMILGGMENIGKGFADMYDEARILGGAFSQFFVAPFLEGLAAITRGISGVLDYINILPEQFGGAKLGASAAGARQLADELAGLAGGYRAAADAMLKDPFGAAGKGVGDFFDRVRGRGAGGAGTEGADGGPDVKLAGKIATFNATLEKQIEGLGMSADALGFYKLQLAGATDEMLSGTRALMEQRNALDSINKAYGAGAGVIEKYNALLEAREKLGLPTGGMEFDLDQQLADKAEKTKFGNRSKLDKFLAEKDDLEEMLSRGLIGGDDFGGAMAKLTKDAAKDLGIGGEVKLAGGAEAGSAAAQSILNRAGVQTNNDPTAILKQILQALQADSQSSRQEAREMVGAFRDGGVNLVSAGL